MIALGLLLALGASPCQPVEGMRILGQHLAAADPNFAGIAPDLSLGYAPTPGVRRVFKASDLARIALANGLPASAFREICFEWPLSVLDAQQMVAAMRSAPALGEAPIEIVEFSRYPAPRGAIVFPPAGLSAADLTGNSLWRGYVQYAPSQRFPIWARVKIATREKRIVAARALRAGEPILSGDVREEDSAPFSFRSAESVRIEDVVGQTPRRAIRPGDTISRNLLAAARDVKRGDSVEVTVAENNLLFRVEAKAEADGRRGETILVRNLASGNKFQAIVDGPGRVSVASNKGTSE